MKHVVFDCDGTLLDMDAPAGVRAYPGIPELLARLDAAGCRLYVWTGRDRASTLRYLRQVDLLRFFHDLRTSSEGPPKPHPQGILDLLDGARPSTAAVVGDSWADMQGARAAGCVALGACWNPRSSKGVLSEHGAHALAESPEGCYDLLLRLTQG